jgi:hypothetical protein
MSATCDGHVMARLADNTSLRDAAWWRWAYRVALATAMMGFAWASYRAAPLLLWAQSDTWVHLALTRRTLEHGWFPGDGFYVDARTPPYYSLEHILLAAVSALSGSAPHELWQPLSPVATAVTLAVTFAWLRELTGDPRMALLGTCVELLVTAPYDPPWAVPLYPRAVALIPRALALLCFVRARRTGEAAWAWAAGGALGVCIATHLFIGVFTILNLVFLALAFGGVSRRLVQLPALGVALGVPWILNAVNAWRHRETLVSELFDPTRPLFNRDVWTAMAGAVPLTMYRPTALFSALQYPALWVAVGVGLSWCLAALLTRQTTVTERYVLWSTLGTALLLFTPMYGVALAVGGVWSMRLVQVVPVALLAGLGIVRAIDVGWRIPAATWRVVYLLVVATLLVLGASHTLRDVQRRADYWAFWSAAKGIAPFGDWHIGQRLDRRGGRPRVVLSDPTSSYLLPYTIGSYVVAMPAAHGSAYVDHSTRNRAVMRAFNPKTPTPELLAILDMYGVDAVAVAELNEWPTKTHSDRFVRRLRRLPFFEDTGCCDALRVFRYHPPARGTTP